MATQPLDIFQRAHQDGIKAVSTFLPTLVGRREPPPQPPPHPSQVPQMDGLQEAARVMHLASHVEQMSARVARGLPPEPPPPPTPEEQFGRDLSPVHIRALSNAVASLPEEHRGGALAELHTKLVNWIGSHNGIVTVDGKLIQAKDVNQAEREATKIVNGAVDDHDAREQSKRDARDAMLAPAQGRASAAPPEASGSISSPQQPTSTGSPAPTPPAAPVPAQAAQPGSSLPPHPSAIPSAPSGAPGASPVQSAAGPSVPLPEIVPPEKGKSIEPLGDPRNVNAEEAGRIGSTIDGRQVMQPRKGIVSNRKLALQAAPVLEKTLMDAAGQVPGANFVRMRPQKSVDRLGDKDGHPSTLSDYLGGQIAVDTPQAKDALVQHLTKLFPAVEVDDQFDNGRPEKAGYASTNLQLQMPNGLTAEVQIVPKEVSEANEQSHPYYSAGRDAESKGDTKTRDELWAKASEINQDALQRFKERNGIQGQPEQVSPQGGNAGASAGDSTDHGARVRDILGAGGYKAGSPVTIGGKMFVPVDTSGAQPQGPDASVTPAHTEGAEAAATPSAPDAADGGKPPEGTNISPTQPPRPAFSKGDSVTLKDGSPASVAYVHPSLGLVRVRDGEGRSRTVNPQDILPNS